MTHFFKSFDTKKIFDDFPKKRSSHFLQFSRLLGAEVVALGVVAVVAAGTEIVAADAVTVGIDAIVVVVAVADVNDIVVVADDDALTMSTILYAIAGDNVVPVGVGIYVVAGVVHAAGYVATAVALTFLMLLLLL